jgi:HAD superfamily hydrolase (TIGR01549 family)
MMRNAMVMGVTFDFWDTLAADDSDEPKRAALGLPSKSEARAQLFAESITSLYPHVSHEQAIEAYRQANERFATDWRDHHRTPGVTVRLYYAYEYLGLHPGPGQYARLVREVDELVRAIETMEIRIPPDFAPGVHSTLHLLSEEYQLGVISDTIHTNGRGLRHLLRQQGILQYFSYFVFSDEVGVSKPSAAAFQQAALGLGLPPRQIVHVGDRESNDVNGPLSIGMHSILYIGMKDRGSQRTRAQAVCRDFRDLPAIIRRIS